jgi:hypothetical protein
MSLERPLAAGGESCKQDSFVLRRLLELQADLFAAGREHFNQIFVISDSKE